MLRWRQIEGGGGRGEELVGGGGGGSGGFALVDERELHDSQKLSSCGGAAGGWTHGGSEIAVSGRGGAGARLEDGEVGEIARASHLARGRLLFSFVWHGDR